MNNKIIRRNDTDSESKFNVPEPPYKTNINSEFTPVASCSKKQNFPVNTTQCV